MTRRFGSIRSKVLLCVSIALFGYFAATLISFYVNLSQYQRLSHLQQTHLPLATLGDSLLNLFEQQAEEYEDAFLIGEQDLVEQANAITPRLLRSLNQLLAAVGDADDRPVPLSQLETLKQDYLAFSAVASTMQPEIHDSYLSRDSQKTIQNLGQMQQVLMEDFRSLSGQLKGALIQEIERSKGKALSSIFLLAVLFMIVLLLVALIVDRVSSSLLVLPLTRIHQNVKRMEQGREVPPPTQSHHLDEIGQLATAFWEMTQRLKKTTVSKRYVDNIIRNMLGALVVIDPDLTIRKINQQTVQLFGYEESELQGKTLDMLVADGEEDSLSDGHLAALLQGRELELLETCCVDRDGQRIPTHFSGSAMYDEEGVVSGIVCVFKDITALKEAKQKLTQMAHYDALTGLPNRNLFFDRLKKSLADGKRHGRIFALLYLDLDNFKPINDALGHEIGDMALREVGLRLSSTVRANDTVARVGGDEFIIILNGLNCADAAKELADKVIQTVTAPFTFAGISHQLGVSVGISVFPDDGTDMDLLIAKADRAMYAAKQNGGNTFYPPNFEQFPQPRSRSIL